MIWIQSYLPFIAIFISITSLVISYSNSRNFAKNEFVKKQIELISRLVKHIQSQEIEFHFTNSKRMGMYQVFTAQIYSICQTLIDILEKDSDFFTNPIYFHGSCNQLLEIKEIIYDPFLPKSISRKLDVFYTNQFRTEDRPNLDNQMVIVAATPFFEPDKFMNTQPNSKTFLNPSCFAMENWDNLILCSKNLEEAIIKFLEKYNVKEINLKRNTYFD